MGNNLRSGYHPPSLNYLRKRKRVKRGTISGDSTLSLTSISTTLWKKGMVNEENVTRYLLDNPDFLDDFVDNHTTNYRIREWFKMPLEQTVDDDNKRVETEMVLSEFHLCLKRMYAFVSLFSVPKQPTLSEIERLLGVNEFNDSNPPVGIESHIFSNMEIPNDKINFVFMYMTEKLFGTTAFPRIKFATFLATVQANYFAQPYHNYHHAIGHAQSMYWLLRNNYGMFSELEMKTLMISSLCHDIGHPGFGEDFLCCGFQNFAFDIPHMEQYHTQKTYCIIFNENSNIFFPLTEADFMKVIIEIRMCILSTYFKEYSSKVEQLKSLIEDGFDISNPECKEVAMCMLMILCDLSSSWKDWRIHLSTTWVVYEEFYNQGEKTEKLGLPVLPQYLRRNMNKMPEYQIEFLGNFIVPMFRIAVKIFPCLAIAIEQTEENRRSWIEDLRILTSF